MAEDIFGGGSSSGSSSGESIFRAPKAAPSAQSAAPSHHGEGLFGLIGETAHIVENAPVALFDTAKSAVGDVPRLYKAEKQEGLAKTLFQPWTVTSKSHVIHGFEQSLGRTASDVIHPTHITRAYEQGHLVGKLVEDVANASLLGEAAGAPLARTAAGADEAATAAEKAATEAADAAQARAAEEAAARSEAARSGVADPALDARVANASAARTAAEDEAGRLASAAEAARARAEQLGSLSDHLKAVQKVGSTVSNPIELAGRAAKAGGGALVDLAARVPEESRLSAVGDVASRLQGLGREHTEAKLARGVIGQSKFAATRETTPIIQGGIARSRILQNPTEEAAATLVHLDQRAQTTAAPYIALEHAGEHAAALDYVRRTADQLGIDPSQLHLAYRTLDPAETGADIAAARTRMGAASSVYFHRQMLPAEQSYLTGRGEPEPLDATQAEYRRKNVYSSEPVRGESDAERALIENAPSRYRPALIAGTRALGVVDDMRQQFVRDGDTYSAQLLAGVRADVITTLDQAVHEGVDPLFVQGGEIPQGVQAGRVSGLPRQRATGSRIAKKGESQPLTVEAQTRLIVKRANIIANNEAAGRLQEAMGATAADFLGDDAAHMTPRDIAAAARQEGLRAWNPRSPFDTIPDGQVSADTTFIPEKVWNVYRNHYRQWTPENLPVGFRRGALAANDLALRGFKAGVLYLSPRWMVGHIIGHAVLATFGAGLSPQQWLEALAQARRVLNGGDLSDLTDQQRSLLGEHGEAPGELIGRGQGGIDEKTQSRLQPGGRAVPKGLHPIRWSQHAVSFTDDLDRVAIALAKAKKGLTDSEREQFRAGHPELANVGDAQLVNEYAIRESLKAQGDYTDLTPFEQQVMGRIVLFYPWIKHMTRLTFQLAIHHPLRVAWALHLADLYGQNAGHLPLTRGKVPLGNQWYLSLPKTDPFGSVVSNFGATGTGNSPLSAVSPVIQAAAAGGLGFDVSKLQLLEHPPGSGHTDEYGRPSWGPLGFRQFGNYLAGESPQVGAAASILPSLVGHQPVVRYPTGEAIHVSHADLPMDEQRVAPFSGGGSIAPLLSLLGIPTATKIDEAAILQRVQQRQAELAKQRASYRQLLGG